MEYHDTGALAGELSRPSTILALGSRLRTSSSSSRSPASRTGCLATARLAPRLLVIGARHEWVVAARTPATGAAGRSIRAGWADWPLYSCL